LRKWPCRHCCWRGCRENVAGPVKKTAVHVVAVSGEDVTTGKVEERSAVQEDEIVSAVPETLLLLCIAIVALHAAPERFTQNTRGDLVQPRMLCPLPASSTFTTAPVISKLWCCTVSVETTGFIQPSVGKHSCGERYRKESGVNSSKHLPET